MYLKPFVVLFPVHGFVDGKGTFDPKEEDLVGLVGGDVVEPAHGFDEATYCTLRDAELV
ncbi:MAG: hypothetical protein IKE03_06275 [Blautia sp.]|nr:hypothetical protein [Blautia sp.]